MPIAARLRVLTQAPSSLRGCRLLAAAPPTAYADALRGLDAAAVAHLLLDGETSAMRAVARAEVERITSASASATDATIDGIEAAARGMAAASELLAARLAEVDAAEAAEAEAWEAGRSARRAAALASAREVAQAARAEAEARWRALEGGAAVPITTPAQRSSQPGEAVARAAAAAIAAFAAPNASNAPAKAKAPAEAAPADDADDVFGYLARPSSDAFATMVAAARPGSVIGGMTVAPRFEANLPAAPKPKQQQQQPKPKAAQQQPKAAQAPQQAPQPAGEGDDAGRKKRRSSAQRKKAYFARMAAAAQGMQ